MVRGIQHIRIIGCHFCFQRNAQALVRVKPGTILVPCAVVLGNAFRTAGNALFIHGIVHAFNSQNKVAGHIFIGCHQIQHLHGCIRFLADGGDHPAAQYGSACANHVRQLEFNGLVRAVSDQSLDVIRAIPAQVCFSED